MPLNSVGNVNTMLMSMPVGGGDPSLINGASSSSSRSMLSLEVVGAGVSTSEKPSGQLLGLIVMSH
jgi:hypothetical protein